MDWDIPLMLNTSQDDLVFDYERILRLLNLTAPPEDKDQYTRDLVTYFLMGIGGMILCVLGIVGNALSFIVLTRKPHMQGSTYSYLSALSVCDSLVLIFTAMLLIKDVQKPIKGEQRWPWDEGIYPYMFPYVHPLAFTFQVISIWLTLAFTVDRYIMICHPFKAEPFCTISRARKVIVWLFIFGVIFNLPKFFEYETVRIHIPYKNTSKIGCDLTEFGRHPIFRELYHSWFYIIFVCVVPFFFLAVLNSFLIHAVKLSRQRGREINAMEKKRNDTTIMLIGVVVVFFICQMPALVSRIIWAFEHDPKAFRKLPLYVLNELGNFLMILNSAINIVPYYFFGQKFRKVFWKLFCNCLLKSVRFQKFTRSFSLTVMEHRRSSNVSMQHSVNTRNGSAAYVEYVRAPRKPSNLAPHDETQECSLVSGTKFPDCPAAEEEHKLVSTNGSEVNGNCVRMVTNGPSTCDTKEELSV